MYKAHSNSVAHALKLTRGKDIEETVHFITVFDTLMLAVF